MNFFYLLEEERKRLGLSQAEAGRVCGVSREMWGKYERDQAAPGADVLEAFAAAGADVNYILSGRRSEALAHHETHQANQDVRPYGLSADESEMLEGYRRSTPEVQAALRVLAGVAPKAAPRQPKTAVVFGGEYKGARTGPQVFSEEIKPAPGKKRKESEP